MLTCLVVSAWPAWSHAGERVLFDFTSGFDLNRIDCSDARTALVAAPEGRALRISTGHARSWPSVTLPAPEGRWDLSPFSRVVLDVRNVDKQSFTIYCRADSPGPGGKQHQVTGSVKLDPGEQGRLHVMLKRGSESKLDGKLFGMRGYPLAPDGPRAVDVSNIVELTIFLNRPTADHVFEVTRIWAEGSYTRPTAWVTDAHPYFPLIDAFGQYKHKDWPGKVHSVAELQDRRWTEERDLKAHPGPAGWCEYGGWARGPRLEGTGFFRVAKHQGRWWLIDPHGHLFWSHGVDCVLLTDYTVVEEREHWFDGLERLQAQFPDLVRVHRASKGHYAGRSVRCFSFGRANLLRKYGSQWLESVREITQRRLRSWGLNTIGNWSETGLTQMRRTPYVDSFRTTRARVIEGSEGYWGKFPDVFDDSFLYELGRAMEAKRRTSVNDPWCIGYFSDNELGWGDSISLAVAALKSPSDQPAKRAFVAQLKDRYRTIDRLNAAWDTSYASWEALLESREPPAVDKARTDLEAFYLRLAERYFRLARQTVKAVAPNQLYLGCRFAWVNDLAARAASTYCDVVSYNRYRRSVEALRTVGQDKPFLIGEFHFGALDRGLFHTGLVPVDNQQERAAAYLAYVRGALRNPQCVGTHWFQFQDEPTTGRWFDEENYQIGFVDIADTPYPETVAAARTVGDELYTSRLAP